MEVTSATFIKLGNKYTKSSMTRSKNVALRRYKAFFGVTSLVCSIIWAKLRDELPVGAEPKHLLWSLLFLKQYGDEHNRRSVVLADEKSIRKWTWIFVKLLADMDVINWENRFNQSAVGQTCFVSLDGVDCKIREPQPFSPLWYSHKFKGPRLRYEVGLNIRSGDMVWVFGGYPCGEYSDLKLSRESYTHSVNHGEKTIADRGYKDQTFFILPNNDNRNQHSLIMARHETVNKRLKQFKTLKEAFRNNIKKHPMVFHAVANLTQLMIENGEPLFSLVNRI